jgi:glycosyltransferase involved in cell wall biosynthesis
MPPDISVIVPTYRRPGLLAEAVRSALSQQGVTVEVLVLDDSLEGSAREAVAALGDARVTYRKREAPSGGNPAVVRNEGWPLAQGRLVAFLDDDDLVEPGAYRALAAALDADPGAAMAFGRVEPFGASGAELAHEMAFFLDAAHRARHAQWSRSRRYKLATLLFEGALFVSSACLVRREALAQLGGLDPDTRMFDLVDFCARATRLHDFVFVDATVARFRYDAGSLVHEPGNAPQLREAYARMHASYRKSNGMIEFAGLKLFARTLKRLL